MVLRGVLIIEFIDFMQNLVDLLQNAILKSISSEDSIDIHR
jgi:hypothetical protein